MPQPQISEEARPPCNKCGNWVPERERTVDEYRNGSRYILCQTCDSSREGPYGKPIELRKGWS